MNFIVFAADTREIILYFFFQAEDGIRDRNVTGVQTCALPISTNRRTPASRAAARSVSVPSARSRMVWAKVRSRSEERRVGEECRCRWWPDQHTKKEDAADHAARLRGQLRHEGRGLRVHRTP